MQGTYIAANESECTDVSVVTGHVGKHFTTWMQEGQDPVYLKRCNHQQTKWLVLADGTSLSIQAGHFLYCAPRVNQPYQKYTHFEIGFPSRVIDELMPYVDDEENPTDTVYGYVPIEVIERVIHNAGGVAGYTGELIEQEIA